MNNFTIVENPIIQGIGLKLHDTNTSPSQYRKYCLLLGQYMGIDLAQRGILPTKKVLTQTPLGKLESKVVDDANIGIVNVLRAGTNMALGMGEVLVNSPIAFVSAWRREERGKMVADTDYTRGIESLKDKYVIITDPALATGVSILACIDICKEYIDTRRIAICCLHAAKEGIESIYKEHKDIHIYSVFGPNPLNEKAYIVNGPGDCGDRCFNTI
jgi:uracil phosphoribosyltransferase